MSAINVNSITGRTGTHGPVLTGVTTATNGLHVTGGSGNVLIGGTLPSSPNISLNANGSATMTGDLTLPIARATDHMEGVYSSSLFNVGGITGLGFVDLDIPTWCNKIEVNYIDQNSLGTTPGTDVCYWQFLDGSNTLLTTTTGGTRNFISWGAGYAGSQSRQNLTNATVFGIPAATTNSGTWTIHMADGYFSAGANFRSNFVGHGEYLFGASQGPWECSGIMIGTGSTMPSKIRFGTYQPAVGSIFAGKVKFFN